MKKAVLIFATLSLCITGFAQDIVVESALTELKSNNLDEAKADIDKAMAFPGTAEKPKALFAKARIYMELQNQKLPKYIDGHPYREAAKALIKLAEVKPDFEKISVDNFLFNCAVSFFNDGAKAFNNKGTAEGVECMLNVVKIHDLNGGKRYEKYTADKFPAKKFDTISANANVSAAISYFYENNFEKALPLILNSIHNPITKSASNYNLLIETYEKLNNPMEMEGAIKEGGKNFPNDVHIRNKKIDYFIKTGKQEELVKELEQAASSDPKNADIHFNLALTYLNIVASKDTTKHIDKPELYKKAEVAFKHTLEIVPDNPVYNFNFGVLYYDQGNEANNEMNIAADRANEKGNKNAKADQKKYEDLKVVRDDFFSKSLPYFEKVYGMYSGKECSISKDDKIVYRNALTALKDAYTILGKNDKYKEVKDKLDALGND